MASTGSAYEGGAPNFLYMPGGKPYDQQWAEYEASQIANAKNAGTAAGTGLSAAMAASGIPTGTGTVPGGAIPGAANAPTVGFPGTSGSGSSSLQGLQAASGVAGADVPTLQPVDTTAAQDAAFAHAKDQVGLETSGALTGLRSALGGRGMLGSGLEERGTAAVANRGQGELGDTSRQAAITAADLANKNATTNFEGGITERGQTLSAEEAANTLAGENTRAGYAGQIAQRGQDITAQSERDRLAMEQAQLIAGQRNQVLSGLMSALSPSGASY